MNRPFYRDPKGRSSNKPPYIYFHRYEWEDDDTEWMDRIDREIEDRKRELEERRKERRANVKHALDTFLVFICILLIVSLIILTMNSFYS